MISSYLISTLGYLAMQRGDFDKAELYYQSCLTMRQELGMLTGLVFILRSLGDLATLTGELSKGKQYLRQSLKLADELSMSFFIAQIQWRLGKVALAENNFDTALQFFSVSGLDAEDGGPGWAQLGLNDLPAASRSFEHNLKLRLAGYAPLFGLDALLGMAHVSARTGRFKQALEITALVQHHELVNFELLEKARKLWEELEAEINPALVAAALESGRHLDLNEMAKQILSESETP